jgi:hypothetical protein
VVGRLIGFELGSHVFEGLLPADALERLSDVVYRTMLNDTLAVGGTRPEDTWGRLLTPARPTHTPTSALRRSLGAELGAISSRHQATPGPFKRSIYLSELILSDRERRRATARISFACRTLELVDATE